MYLFNFYVWNRQKGEVHQGVIISLVDNSEVIVDVKDNAWQCSNIAILSLNQGGTMRLMQHV